MDAKQQEEFNELLKLLNKVAANQVNQHAGKLYDIGIANFQRTFYSLAITQFEAAVELGDPFYSANALIILGQAYKMIKDDEKELGTFKRILSLPPESQRFIDPENLGIVYLRLGNPQKASEQYRASIKLNGESPSRLANLTEALLVSRDFEQTLHLSEKLILIGDPKYLVVGRVFKGAALWFLNQKREASNEFQFLGNYLVSTGSIPPSFSWDFRDSERLLTQVDSPLAQSTLAVLQGKTDFTEFRRNLLAAPVPN